MVKKWLGNFVVGVVAGAFVLLAAILGSAFIFGWVDIISHGFCKPESFVGIGGCEGFAESRGLDDRGDDVPAIVDFKRGGQFMLPAYVVAIAVAAFLDARRDDNAGFIVWVAATAIVTIITLADVIESGNAL
jgi:hypothetical protein